MCRDVVSQHISYDGASLAYCGPTTIYRFMIQAPAPKSAAAPIAPVAMGTPPADEVVTVTVAGPGCTVVVRGGSVVVKGTTVAVVVTPKAFIPLVAEGLGVWVVLAGFKTLKT